MSTRQYVSGERGHGKTLVNGFIHLMASQVISRALTFLLNWLVVKRLSPDDYGLSAQFQLLSISILFISREGFRRGCLRTEEDKSGDKKSRKLLMNVAWLTVPCGAILSIGCCIAIIQWQKLQASNPYTKSVLLFGLAAIIELCSEPLYILAQSLLWMRVRVLSDGSATLVRCLVTYSLLLRGTGLVGGVLFAYAEVAYSCTMLVSYWSFFIYITCVANRSRGMEQDSVDLTFPDLFPSRIHGSFFPHWTTLRLCAVFSGQALVKHVLGKGDEMALVFFDTTYNQGVYSLVVNLGSLVVRSVLQPFEESAFLMFTRAAKGQKEVSGANGGESLARILTLCIKLTIYIGLLFVSFGPNYSFTLLSLLYGPKWSHGEAPGTLSSYCFLILVLAVNGITEAFLHAVGDERQLFRSNVFLVLFSFLHMALNIILVKRSGAVGLIFSNCLNMLLRIGYSMVFMSTYFKGVKSFRFMAVLPSRPVMVAFLVAFVATRTSKTAVIDEASTSFQLFPSLGHISVGCLCLVFIGISIFTSDGEFLEDISHFFRRKESGVHKED